MSQPIVRPRVAVAASLIRCAPTPGSAGVLDHVAALRDEADYLLRRYGRERRGLTDEEDADALWLADIAGDLLALSDLYLHAPRPYRDGPRAGRATRRPPALSGLVLIARGTPGPTDLPGRDGATWAPPSGGRRVGPLDRQGETERLENRPDSLERRVPGFGQGLVQALAAEAGVAGDLRHAAGPGDDADRVADQCRVAVLHHGLEVEGDVLVGLEVLGGVVGLGVEGHDSLRSGETLGSGDVLSLGALVAAAQQDDQRAALSGAGGSSPALACAEN